MNKKLDPGLRSKLRAARDNQAKDRSAKVTGGQRIGIIVEFTGNLDDLTAVGFERYTLLQHPTKGYKIATGVIPLERLEDLAAIDHVVDVEGPRRMHSELNYSLPEIHANAVHAGTPSRKGNGVIIGIVDSGIDWRHGSFVNDDGTSRILAIWDQMLRPNAGDTRGPNNIGVVYLEPQITQALRRQARVRTKDLNARNERDGHGTHVAGIAAGNGRPATCCHVGRTYVGVAPSASLIVVRYDYRNADEIGENLQLIHALDYIFEFPGTSDKAKVINISQGDNLGPHDGTSAVERAINLWVETGDSLHLPRIVVKSAGNEGGMLRHVNGTVPPHGHIDIQFKVPEGREFQAFLDLWYDRAGTLNLTVTAPSGANSGVVNHGNDLSFIANPAAAANRQSNVAIDGTINGPHNRDNNFRINIQDPTDGTLPNGDWGLTLANPGDAAVAYHCWIERGEPSPTFLEPKTQPDGKVRATLDSTLSIPGTAAQVITVANHQSRTSACNCWPSTGIEPSSSRGPVIKGGAANRKPDIAAPGLEITSAKADVANFPGHCCACCPDACCCLYEDLTGTSMAAPHVTGAIALLLEENPRLTRADIVRHLQATARERPAGGWDATFGAGKLNIEAAIAAVRAEPHRGGGGGSSRGGRGSPHLHPPTLESFSTGSLMLDRRDESGSASQQASPWLRILRARLRAFPDGEHVAAAISRHFSEVRRLINNNRRIATMWHRAGGPLLLRRLLHGAIDPDAPVCIEGESEYRYLRRCFDLIAHSGSPRLRGSLERYQSLIMSMFEIPIAARIELTANDRI